MEMETHTIEPIVNTHEKVDSFLPISNINYNRDFIETNPFIEANTETVSLSYLKNGCIIPVFSKDNEITISHQEFVNSSFSGLREMFPNEVLDAPEIRVSHQIKGRTPDALQVSAKDLEDSQKTIYYERMAFIIRIPSITREINGNTLSLVAGGVRSYNLENLYSTKKLENFQFFIGFQNMVCCNLCINTDGFKSDIKASSTMELQNKISEVIQNYNIDQQIKELSLLTEQTISEKQFAQLIGKSRLYNYLPKEEKKELPELLLNDSHISAIAKEYYNDKILVEILMEL